MVLCSGCFDGLHAGHVRYLKAAADLRRDGESVAVALASDLYFIVNKSRTSRWTVEDRALVLRSINMVDQVFIHNEYGAADTILQLRPRLFVKGTDWEGRMCPDVIAACEEAGTEMCFVHTPGKHTSEAFA